MSISPEFQLLPPEEQDFIRTKAEEYRLSFQQTRKLIGAAVDFWHWDTAPVSAVWQDPPEEGCKGKARGRRALQIVETHHDKLRREIHGYGDFRSSYKPREKPLSFVAPQKDARIMGRCPVASEKTRCCNLQTLDAVINCGFDCAYCSIQTFYHDQKVIFHEDLKHKLEELEKGLDPERLYHIGTGQSSDSLMWGNRNGLLDELVGFAERNPHVILELKSKSDQVSPLLARRLPPNLLLTWSLNTPLLIANEEHLTAPLEKRLVAARLAADAGALVGFHFHPLVYYENWKRDYRQVFQQILEGFAPEEVCMVSLGTLTFIKPVLKQLRKRPLKTRIYQMPWEEIGGKLSYPYAIKEELFRFAYNQLSPWHGKVFFYLCMEDIRLWKPVLGREYPDNRAFEEDMLKRYREKIDSARERNSS